MEAKETYVNRDRNTVFGGSGWQTTFTDNRGELFRSLQKEFGRCESRMYADTPEGTKPVGWVVFAKRMRYEDARFSNRQDFYIREVWVEVR